MKSQHSTMRSSRPYLVRALSDWILDNNATPHVLVDAGMPGVQVPTDYVANDQIVLNISPTAVRGLSLGNEALQFSARFGGVPMQVYVPMHAILAIYAKENGQGMVFGQEPGDPDPDGTEGPEAADSQPSEPATRSGSSKPKLKVVK